MPDLRCVAWRAKDNHPIPGLPTLVPSARVTRSGPGIVLLRPSRRNRC